MHRLSVMLIYKKRQPFQAAFFIALKLAISINTD
jgi:hypothetical protein